MKKVVILIFLCFINLSLFSQNMKYDDIMQKAKKAEENHEWIYALGNYFDAAHLETAMEEPRLRYKEIKNGFLNGNIGLDECSKNPFTKQEQWIKVKEEFLRYFSQNPTFDFYSSDLKEVRLNAEERTAEYKVYVYTSLSQKFILIRDILVSCLPKDISLFDIQIDYKKYSKNYSDDFELYSDLYKAKEEGI